jgi:CRP-like cAMP-binding protein/phosphoribosyl 1,2-cyclic phosphodiesterase
MNDEIFKKKKIILNRGGIIINTQLGPIQVGIPPETIKDCMNMGISIPNYFVFPKELFDRVKGINIAEAEFPAYFNFFILNKVVNFICKKSQEKQIREIFQQTLLGPKEIDIRKEYVTNLSEDQIPDLLKECAYIRTFHSIDELFKFHHFNDEGICNLENNVQIKDLGEEFIFLEDGKEIERTASKITIPPNIWQGSVLARKIEKPFDPPLFGITILGSGHGFDPCHRTSGFVLWLNKRGIMVDPPLNSRAILQQAGVPSRLIDSVIITHCHADHDQGTFQKLLEEKQIQLITTYTILGSFLKKYSALTELSEDFLRRLFIYRPVLMGEPMKINGGEIRFFYSIHTIPCIGFEVYYGGKSMYFSGDTCWDPVFIKKMLNDGILKSGRANMWLNLQWHHNLILHEAGVPPIHTPISVLANLPSDIKKRLYLIHTSKKSLPPETELKIAPEGVENTITLNVTPHIHSEAIELLKVIDSIDMFHVFTLEQARELLQNVIPKHYKAGDIIIEKGTDGNEFFIITSGIVCIPDGKWNKNLVIGDYFGEMSLVTGTRRTASVIAKTNVDVISFKKEDFLSILRGNTESVEFIQNLSKRRQEPSWEIISFNSILTRMTNAQKTRFQALLQKKDIKKNEYIWKNGEPATIGYLIGEGQVKFEEKKDLAPFTCGAFVGEINAILNNGYYSTSMIALTDGWGYTISRQNLCEFLNRNPGVNLCFLDTIFIDTVKEQNYILSSEDNFLY